MHFVLRSMYIFNNFKIKCLKKLLSIKMSEMILMLVVSLTLFYYT